MGQYPDYSSFGNSSYLIDDKTVNVVRAGQASIASTPPFMKGLFCIINISSVWFR